MKYLGSQSDDKDLVSKKYVDDHSSGGGGLSQQVSALLMSILQAGTYSPDQSANLAALAALILTITITQNGTTLIISGVPDVRAISQSGTTLALT